MTVTGAVLTWALLGPTAWPILRGDRANGRAVPQDEDARWDGSNLRRPVPPYLSFPAAFAAPKPPPESRGLRRSAR